MLFTSRALHLTVNTDVNLAVVYYLGHIKISMMMTMMMMMMIIIIIITIIIIIIMLKNNGGCSLMDYCKAL